MYAVPVLVDNYGSANTGRLFLIQISAEKAGVCKTCTKINNSTNSKCYESYITKGFRVIYERYYNKSRFSFAMYETPLIFV